MSEISDVARLVEEVFAGAAHTRMPAGVLAALEHLDAARGRRGMRSSPSPPPGSG